MIYSLNENLQKFNEISSINENLLSEKIRVTFIRQISVGKLTILNYIIGEKILPTNISKCTYREIIIKQVPSYKDFYSLFIVKELLFYAYFEFLLLYYYYLT